MLALLLLLLPVISSRRSGTSVAWWGLSSSATASTSSAVASSRLSTVVTAAAMRRMAQRTGAEEVASLVAVLIQSERFGTSVGDALRTFAASMRERRSQRAAEAAEKMAVKLLLPMALFIFPTILIVAAGPSAAAVATCNL